MADTYFITHWACSRCGSTWRTKVKQIGMPENREWIKILKICQSCAGETWWKDRLVKGDRPKEH